MCCVVLGHSISLRILSTYKAVICDGITTDFVDIFLFVCRISVCLYIYVFDAYKMLCEIDIISNSLSQKFIPWFMGCPRQYVANQIFK